MMLAAGTVGSVFGAGGRVLGQRLGLIVGTQIAWHRLIQPVEEPPVLAVMPPDAAIEPPAETPASESGPAEAGAATEQGSAAHLESTLDQEAGDR